MNGADGRFGIQKAVTNGQESRPSSASPRVSLVLRTYSVPFSAVPIWTTNRKNISRILHSQNDSGIAHLIGHGCAKVPILVRFGRAKARREILVPRPPKILSWI
jgi:hypothetical protein